MKRKPDSRFRNRDIFLALALCLLFCGFGSHRLKADSSLGMIQRIQSASADHGITLSADYTGEVLGNLTGGLKSGSVFEGLLRLNLQLDLAKLLCWKGGSFNASLLDPHGEGISREYSGDFNLASNIDAHNGVRLFELWFQQNFCGDTLSIRIGQMAADQEFFLSTNSALFLNSGFGAPPTISFDSQLPVYPVGGFGVRLQYKPNEHYFLRAVIFDASPGNQATNDKNGAAFHVNPGAGEIFLLETGYAVNASPDAKGLTGTYTIGAWFDSSLETSPGLQGAHNSDYCLYLMIDQMIYRNSSENSGLKDLGAFFRLSGAPRQDRNLVPFYFDAGFNLIGLIPSREKDVYGIALGYTKLSDELMVDGIKVHSAHETVLETTYKIQVNDHFYVQPDLQYILDPGAFRHLSNALVAGVRFDLTF
jgi:porin